MTLSHIPDEGGCLRKRFRQCGPKGQVPSGPRGASGCATWRTAQSTATERQLFDVLDRPYFTPLIVPAARGWLAKLLAMAEPVPIIERIVACRDPTDDKFLDLAVNGYADFIISSDADLLVLNPSRGIPIVSPAAFVHETTR